MSTWREMSFPSNIWFMTMTNYTYCMWRRLDENNYVRVLLQASNSCSLGKKNCRSIVVCRAEITILFYFNFIFNINLNFL